MAYNDDILSTIQHEVKMSQQRVTAKGTATSTSTKDNNIVYVMFDGSAQAVPIKAFGNLYVRSGDRVGLLNIEGYWHIIGTFGRGLPVSQVADPATRDLLFPSDSTPSGQQVWTVSTGELEVWDGTQWSGVKSRFKRKTADQDVNNNATPQNDNHISFSVEANTWYLWRFVGLISTNSPSGLVDFKSVFAVPANSLFYMGQHAPDTGASSLTASSLHSGGGVDSLDGIAVSGTVNGLVATLFQHGIVFIGDTSGTMQLQFCNLAAGTANTTLKKGTHVELRKLGASG